MYCMNLSSTWLCASRPAWSRFMTNCTECTVWTHVIPGFAPLGQPEAGSWTLVRNVMYELMFYLDMPLSASLKQIHTHLYKMYCINPCPTWICDSQTVWSRFMNTYTECTVWTHVLPEFAPLSQPEADSYPPVQNVLYKPLFYLDLRLSDSLKQVHEHLYGMYCMNSCSTWFSPLSASLKQVHEHLYGIYCMNSCSTWICASRPAWIRFMMAGHNSTPFLYPAIA